MFLLSKMFQKIGQSIIIQHDLQSTMPQQQKSFHLHYTFILFFFYLKKRERTKIRSFRSFFFLLSIEHSSIYTYIRSVLLWSSSRFLYIYKKKIEVKDIFVNESRGVEEKSNEKQREKKKNISPTSRRTAGVPVPPSEERFQLTKSKIQLVLAYTPGSYKLPTAAAWELRAHSLLIYTH